MSLFQHNGITMRTMNVLEMGMDAALVRRQTLANNVANVDVPHFKRSEVVFESELKRAVESEQKERERPPIRYNHERHIKIFQPRDFRAVKAKVHTDYTSIMRNDGNNVDMEQEMTKAARNQMQYSLMIDRMGGTFRMLNSLSRLT